MISAGEIGAGIYLFMGVCIGLISASDKGVFKWGHFTVVVLFWPVILVSLFCWSKWHDNN